ncbi:MAG: hypothetical protein NZ455_06900 [Bacteroidia bacterium]|nr:hypothetical protein [Bacteroidia bacterium]
MKTRKIVTTAGTSVFTNLITNDNEIKNTFTRLDGLPYGDWEKNQEIIEGKEGLSITQGLRKSVWDKIQNNPHASAEITSVLKITEEIQSPDTQIEVYLIATDTIVGALACELIKEWFKKNHPEITVIFERTNSKHVIPNLRVDEQEYYNEGFDNLIQTLSELKLTPDDFLNITGGYKGIIPIMTLFAQLVQVPLCYIYNENPKNTHNRTKEYELVTVGNLPLDFDAIFAESYYPYLQNLNFLKEHKNKPIVETLQAYKLICRTQKGYDLTPLGELYKAYIDQNLAESKQVLGLLVEYKIFEHLLENGYTCKNDTILHKIEHSKKDSNFCPNEIDLVMSNDTQTVIGEVKSYLRIYESNRFTELKEQVERQINGLKKEIKEYVLYIYLNDVAGNGFDIMNREKWKLMQLQNIVKAKFSRCTFRVFLVFINHNEVTENSRYKNVYMKFIQNKLNIREYNL